MNRGLLKNVRRGLLLAAGILIFAAAGVAQKRDGVKPPPETASLAETQEWLIGAVGKYASYKTRVSTVTLSKVKFDACTFSFTETRKSASTSTATMGATRTTNAAKYDTSFDVTQIRTDGISVTDHIYPEVQTIQVWMSGFDLKEGSTNGRIYEIVVKREAADAIKTGLVQIRRLCTAKN